MLVVADRLVTMPLSMFQTNDGFTEDSGDENVPSEMTSKIILAWEDIECTVPTICMRQKNHTDLGKLIGFPIQRCLSILKLSTNRNVFLKPGVPVV